MTQCENEQNVEQSPTEERPIETCEEADAGLQGQIDELDTDLGLAEERVTNLLETVAIAHNRIDNLIGWAVALSAGVIFAALLALFWHSRDIQDHEIRLNRLEGKMQLGPENRHQCEFTATLNGIGYCWDGTVLWVNQK